MCTSGNTYQQKGKSGSYVRRHVSLTHATAHTLHIDLHALIAIYVDPWNWKLTRNFGDRPMGAWKSKCICLRDEVT